MIAYHVTDDPNFRIKGRDEHVPTDFYGAAPMVTRMALFASLIISEWFWESMAFYRFGACKYVVVLSIDDTRDDAIEQGRWFADEVIITDPDAVEVLRIIECEPCENSDGWRDCSGYHNPWGRKCGECGSRPF